MKIFIILLLSLSVNAFSETFKVLNWNIYMLPKIAKKVKQDQRIGPIAKWISKTDYDFVMLQEVFTRSGYNTLVRELKHKYPYNTGRPFRKWYRPVNSGLVIFSKYPLNDTKIYLYYRMAHADRFSSKGFLITTATLPNGKKVQLGTTHLQAQQGQDKDAIRSRQLRKFEKWILGKEKNPNYPFLVAGDFNIDWYRHHQAPEFIDRVSSHSVTLEVPQGDMIYSSNYQDNDLTRVLKPNNRSQKFIDYIFAYPAENQGIRYVHQKILDIEGEYVLRKKPGIHNLSDHHAVEATFETY